MIVECRPPWRKGLGPEWNPGCGGGEGTAGFWGAASWTMPLEPVSSPWMTGAFECSVDDDEIGRFEQLLGDHHEGQFEGQNGARECLCEPVSACVS
jgi:hypothetical protein